MKRSVWITTGVFAALLLLGCGGSSSGYDSTLYTGGGDGDYDDDDGVVPAPNTKVVRSGTGTVIAILGPPGGTLELVGGARVDIPPGSLQGGMEFVLKGAPKTTAFLNEEGERPVGPTFVFSPEVWAPEGRTVTVSIPLASYPQGWGEVALAYEETIGARVGAEDSQHTRWQYENGRLSGGRAIADVEGLNGNRLQFVLTNLEVQ